MRRVSIFFSIADYIREKHSIIHKSARIFSYFAKIQKEDLVHLNVMLKMWKNKPSLGTSSGTIYYYEKSNHHLYQQL